MTLMISSIARNKTTYAFSVLLIMMLVSDDTITFGITESSFLFVLKCLVYLMLLFCMLLFTKTTLIIKNAWPLLLIIVSITLASLANSDVTGGYLYQIFIVLLSFLIVNSIEINIFLSIYSKMLYFLSTISIVLYLISISYNSLLSYLPVYESLSGVQYINIYLGAIYVDTHEIRSIGIFREPGVFMIYLLLGVVLELFYYSKINARRLIIYLLALVTTFSTAAFILGGMLIASFYLKLDKITMKSKLLLSLPFIAIGYLLYRHPDLYWRVFSKFNVDSSKYLSSVAREASVTVSFRIFKDHLFFGAGLTPYVNMFESYAVERYGIPFKSGSHSTNTFMAIFATYGFLYGSILLTGIFKLSRMLTPSFLLRSVLFLSLLLMFSNEDMRYSLFFNALVFYGLKYRPLSLRQNSVLRHRVSC